MTKALPALALVGALSQLGQCGNTVVRCPVTANCPKGQCVPVGSVDAEGHPGVSLVCKNPLTPPSPPMPTPTPTATPSESPAPSPTPVPPVCIAAPTSAPGPGRWECSRPEPGAAACCLAGWTFFPAPPTPTPSPQEPSPTPRPSSTPVPTCLGVPLDPVPVVYPQGFSCRSIGLEQVEGVTAPNGDKLCVAPSACTAANEECHVPENGITAAMLDGATSCKTWRAGVAYHVGHNNGTYDFDVRGYLHDSTRCLRDAYGRCFREGVTPSRGTLKSLWQVWGECPPQAAMPCATPPPTPWPTATPGPAPTPIVTPPPTSGDAIIPSIGSCPAGWPLRPDFVTIGEKPWRAPANRFAWIFDVNPRRSDPRYCLNEFGVSRGVPCLEWMPCALRKDADGNFISQISAKAWGPGGFNGSDVERRSGNPNLLNMVLGPDGSPPGRYEICVAPTDAQIRTGAGMCRFYDLTLPE